MAAQTLSQFLVPVEVGLLLIGIGAVAGGIGLLITHTDFNRLFRELQAWAKKTIDSPHREQASYFYFPKRRW